MTDHDCTDCGSNAALAAGRLDLAGYCPKHWPECLRCNRREPIETLSDEFLCPRCRP